MFQHVWPFCYHQALNDFECFINSAGSFNMKQNQNQLWFVNWAYSSWLSSKPILYFIPQKVEDFDKEKISMCSFYVSKLKFRIQPYFLFLMDLYTNNFDTYYWCLLLIITQIIGISFRDIASLHFVQTIKALIKNTYFPVS